jgi:hypothetical protein
MLEVVSHGGSTGGERAVSAGTTDNVGPTACPPLLFLFILSFTDAKANRNVCLDSKCNDLK